MEQRPNESASSFRFRVAMHEYAAKHQVLVEESYARYSVKMDEYLRQRREEKRINWNNRKLMCDH